MDEKAKAIAKATFSVLRGAPGLAVSSRASNFDYVELQEVETERFGSKESLVLTERVAMIEKRLEADLGQLRSALSKIEDHLEAGDSKRSERKPLKSA